MTSPSHQSGKPAHQRFARRSRAGRRWVRSIDRIATWVIAIGGIGTIATILLVAIFLAWVVLPLFRSEQLVPQADFAWQSSRETNAHRPLSQHTNLDRFGNLDNSVGIDEYGRIVWTVSRHGKIATFDSTNGKRLTESALVKETPTSLAVSPPDGQFAFGFADGGVQFGKLEFSTEFLESEAAPARLLSLRPNESAPYRGGIVQRTSEGQLRWQELHTSLEPPVRIKSATAIHRLDFSTGSKGRFLAALDRQGKLHVGRVTQKKNLLTGKVTLRTKTGTVDVPRVDGRLPDFVALTGLGDMAVVAWPDGTALRYDLQQIDQPRLAERIDLVPDPQARLTCVAFLIGKTSLVTGDSSGTIRVWFRIKPQQAGTTDHALLVAAHEFPGSGIAVAALAPSPRSRMLAAGFANGQVHLLHVTSEQLLAATTLDQPSDMLLSIAPKDDLLVAATASRVRTWQIDAPHPETTFASIFRPVWYEGYEHPEHVWQSSSGTDDFEPKYGLMPLVFGTLKATLYSLLFAVPLALLAAIYTSEFLQPRVRKVVKPTLEIMASLPSVVLGFLAALVFAPIAQEWIIELLTATITVPFTVLLGAYLWQLLPPRQAVRWQSSRMILVIVAMLGGVKLALVLAPSVEALLFAGNFALWLDGQVGTGTAAWLFLLLPVAAMAATWLIATFVTPRMRSSLNHWTAFPYAVADLAKFLVGAAATLILAYTGAQLLQSIAWDPRGSFVGTYIQRNALIVGATMGFAVIPIIYTIADDALMAVPYSLRAGSLGAGATTWQTAIRVVVPTAMSGLFSAVMVGLGRAVGETMIVLMAAGNTPIMEWNIFSGFRTLSANIAVELPEAVVASTHYRMLFVAALVLFVVTFIVNTAAETIRLRFRKKAFQL